ncbi:MAG: hypothetical protein AB8F74_09260 [Saprospiraceae bacterium]
MKKLILLSTLFSAAFLFYACGSDDESSDDVTDYSYHAHVQMPTTEDKHVNDTMHIHVDFESHTGETVHHINVTIKNKADGTVIYNEPGDAHVHATSGEHGYHDDFILSNVNKVEGHTDWILEAKVWGHEEGEGEAIEAVEFHVHPE